MPDERTGMSSGEYPQDFRSLVLTGLADLKSGQDDQASRITNMHKRQDRVESLLIGTIENPGGMAAQVKSNTDEIGYIKKSRDKVRAWVWGVGGSVIAILVVAAVVAAVKGM